MCDILELVSITGSRARAAVIAVLYGEASRRRSINDLAATAGIPWTAAAREIRRLVRLGLVRAVADRHQGGGAVYEADPSFPIHGELRRLVLSATGTAHALRQALDPLDASQLTWIHGTYALGLRADGPGRIRVVSITKRTREVHEKLAGLGRARREITSDVMSPAEWTQRLERHEMRVWAIRRSPRLWVIGDDARLVQRERHEIEMRATWKHVLENWREEFGWDDDWDPERVAYASTR